MEPWWTGVQAPLSLEELARVEAIVNKQITDDLAVYAKEATLQQARVVNGLRAVFGETYPDPVRVVSVGVPVDELLGNPTDARWLNNSVEFCGGTYAERRALGLRFGSWAREGERRCANRYQRNVS